MTTDTLHCAARGSTTSTSNLTRTLAKLVPLAAGLALLGCQSDPQAHTSTVEGQSSAATATTRVTLDVKGAMGPIGFQDLNDSNKLNLTADLTSGPWSIQQYGVAGPDGASPEGSLGEITVTSTGSITLDTTAKLYWTSASTGTRQYKLTIKKVSSVTLDPAGYSFNDLALWFTNVQWSQNRTTVFVANRRYHMLDLASTSRLWNAATSPLSFDSYIGGWGGTTPVLFVHTDGTVSIEGDVGKQSFSGSGTTVTAKVAPFTVDLKDYPGTDVSLYPGGNSTVGIRTQAQLLKGRRYALTGQASLDPLVDTSSFDGLKGPSGLGYGGFDLLLDENGQVSLGASARHFTIVPGTPAKIAARIGYMRISRGSYSGSLCVYSVACAPAGADLTVPLIIDRRFFVTEANYATVGVKNDGKCFSDFIYIGGQTFPVRCGMTMPGPLVPPPPTPPDFIATYDDPSATIGLYWSDVASETEYAIERSVDNITSFVEIGRTAANVTTFTDSNVPDGYSYNYRLHAINEGGSSFESVIATVDRRIPAAPIKLVGALGGKKQVALSWTDVATDENGYWVQRSDDGGATFQTFHTLPANARSDRDTDARENVTNLYRVVAFNLTGPSKPSNVLEVPVPELVACSGEFCQLRTTKSNRNWNIVSFTRDVVPGQYVQISQVPGLKEAYLLPGFVGDGEEVNPGTTDCMGSTVDNIRWSYSQQSSDVAFGGDVGECGACGCGGSGTAGTNGPLEIKRLHLARYEYLPSSFGPGVFSNFDARLTFYKNGIGGEPNAVLFEPEADAPPVTFFEKSPDHGDNSIDGAYQDKETRSYRRLLLYSGTTPSTSTRVTDPFAARLAVVERNEGGALWFEIINTDPTSADTIEARPSSYLDRNGGQLAVTYQFSALATDQQLGSDRTKLWNISQIADKVHLHSVDVAYEQRPTTHRWQVKTIKRTASDGTVRAFTYKYADAGEGVDTLSEVLYPNGDNSLFTKTFDAATQTWAYRFDDVGLGTSRIFKTVHLTGSTFTTEDGVVHAQTPNLVRRVTNGSNEDVYRNWEDPADPRTTYMLEAGKRITRLKVDDNGFPLELARARAYNDDPTLATYDRVQAFVPDAKGMITQATDGAGGTRRYTRDPLTRQVTGLVARDGTTASWTRNSFGWPTRSVDRQGRAIDATYDSKGNLLGVTRAGTTPASMKFTYDATTGLPTSATDWRGQVTNFTYTSARYLASITGPADTTGGTRPVTKFEYDTFGLVTAKVDPAGRRTTFDYDPRGRLVATHFPDGTTEAVTYGVGFLSGSVVSKKNRNGTTDTFSYDGTRRLERMIKATGSPASLEETYQYAPGSEVESATTVDGVRTEYTYDERYRLSETIQYINNTTALVSKQAYDLADRPVQETDPFGRRTFRVLDSMGRVVRIIRELVPNGVAAGADLTTLVRSTASNPAYTIEEKVYRPMGQLLATIDTRGFRTNHTYDDLGRPIETVEAAGTANSRSTKREYDLAGHLLKETLPRTQREGRSFLTVYTYTNRGLLASKTEASGSTEAATNSFTYTLTGQIATATDPMGAVITRTYDANDRLATSKDPLGGVTTFAYDGAGNRTSTTNPLGLVAKTTYDARNRQLTEVNPANETTSFQYDDDLTDGVGVDATYPTLVSELGFGPRLKGHAISSTNAAGQTTLEIADGLGRPRLRRDPKGNVSRVSYDTLVDGLVVSTGTSSLGNINKVHRDGAERERLLVDAAGKSTSQLFDAGGNVVSKHDANGVGMDCAFNEFNQRTSCIDAQGDRATFEYDAASNAVAMVSSAGVRTTCTFDTLNRKATCKDGLSATTTWSYDKLGRLTKIKDAQGGLTTYTYDARGLKTSATFPDSTTSTDKMAWAYDSAGRLNKITNNSGHIINLAYDAGSRIVTRSYPDGKNDTFTYDAASRMKTATSALYGTKVTWTYDEVGRIAKESLAFQGKNYDVTQTFDGDGRVTALGYPDGSQATRTFSNRDQIETVTFGSQAIASFAYDDGGRLTGTTLGNGLAETRTYRADNRLASLNTPGVGDLGYTYDAAKRKVSESGAAVVGGAQSFTYDASNRLTRWTAGSTTQSWVLSAVGDWTSTTRGTTTESRTHNAAHEVTAVGSATFGYDSRGNMKKNDKGDVFVWDDANQVMTATPSGGATATYFYDATGRKVAKTVGSTTTVFVHAGPQIIAEHVNGAPAIDYVLGAGPDDYLAYTKGGKTYWYTANSLGTVEAITDSTRAVKERYSYTAYGERTIWSATGAKLTASAVGNQVGFTGRYHDDDSKVIDFRARQYDPRLGRFISRDDAYRDGLNLYMAYYVPNSTDPTGHWDVKVILGIRVEAGVRMDVGGSEPGLSMFVKVTAGAGFRVETPFGDSSAGVFGTWEKAWQFLKFEHENKPPVCSNDFRGCCGYDHRTFLNLQTPNVLKGLSEMDLFEWRLGVKKQGCKVRMEITLRFNAGKIVPGLGAVELATEVLKVVGLDGLKTGGYGKIVIESCLAGKDRKNPQIVNTAVMSAEVGLYAQIGNPP